MKVIRTYLLREFVLYLVGTVVVLTLVMSSTRIIRYLASVAQGELPGDAVLCLMALKLLGAQTIIIPVGLFLASLLTLSRWYRDSEMAALSATGISPLQLLIPVGLLGLAAALPVAGLSFYVAPWAEEQTIKIEERVESEPALTGISSGVFRPIDEGQRIFYVQQLSDDRTRLENVFIRDNSDPSRETLIVAPLGRIQIDEANGDQFLVLQQGYRYDGKPGGLDYREMQYEEYALLIQQPELKQKRRKEEALSTAQLWGKGKAANAELQWRLAIPVSTLVLMLMAIPLSYTAPRSGRAGRLALAVMVYMLYTNFLQLSSSWVEDGKLQPWIGLWWVHLAALVLLAIMMINLSNPMVSWGRRLLGWRAG
ncbi:MAG: LPS export ABC transporter permease LptF [Gammaproteobacteria bacterium]